MGNGPILTGWAALSDVQAATDLEVEEQLPKPKREGKELDKSEWVDAPLGAWLKWRQGEDSETLLGEIALRQI